MSSLTSSAGDNDPAVDNRAPDERDGRTGIENVPDEEAECDVLIGIGPEMRRDPALVDVPLRCLTNETTEKDRLRPAGRLGSGALGSTVELKKLRRASDWAIVPGERTSADDALAIPRDPPSEFMGCCAEI